MIESTVICPKCAAKIKLTESLAAPLIEATYIAIEPDAVLMAEKTDIMLSFVL